MRCRSYQGNLSKIPSCTDFGTWGKINLLEGIEHVVDPWEYNITSPPTIVGDNVIVELLARVHVQLRRLSGQETVSGDLLFWRD
jgi:hypothetical protein